MRMLAHVVGMFVFGALALLVPGWLYNARVMQPAPAAPRTATTPTGTTGRHEAAASALLGEIDQGIRGNLETFVHEIGGGDRRQAMHALDAAYHLATVARAASGGAADPLYAQIVAARQAVQNDNRQAAFAHALTAATTRIPAAPATVPAAARLDDYEGATVLSPDGTRLGRVSHVSRDTLTIALGESRLLGLIPAGRTSTVTAVAADMAFGPSSRLRPRMIVWRGP